MEFTFADIFQHSPFGDVLNSLRSLSLSGEPWPNYVQLEWDADDEEIHCPLTTHLVATVDDLTDMLNFDSEDIDGMNEVQETNRNQRPQGAEQPLHHMTYTWWIHPKKAMAKRQWRMAPPRSNPSVDGSGAALSPAIAKTAITAQEKIILQSTLEETMTTFPRRQSTMKLQAANIVRIRRSNTATTGINLIKPPLGRKTVRTKMHTSSRKHTWSKRTSAEGLLPQ